MSDERTALLKAVVLNQVDGKTEQTNEDVVVYGTPDGAIVPALPPESFQKLSEFNSTRSAIIDVIARNSVGLGYTIDVATGFEKEVTDPTGDIRDVTDTLEALAGRDLRLGRPTFTELMYACKHDEEEIGTGAIEVSRDKRTGQISGLFHVPSVRLRRRKDFSGWFLIPMSGAVDESTPFSNFGEKVRYDGNGKPTAKLAQGASWDVNEIMVFRLYNSASRDYGLPRDAAMALEHLGDKLSSESNVSYFDSSGVPPTVLFVQGEQTKGPGAQGPQISFRVPKETTDRIASLLRSDSNRHHKVAVIPVPPGTTTQAIPLGVDKTDMGFVNYRNDNKLRTFGAFRVAPVFLSDFVNSARYTAEVQRAITLEQVFDPEQNRWQQLLGRKLLTELGYPHLALTFRKLAVEGNAVKRQSAEALAQGQAITRREYRAAHGYGPLPEAPKGQQPEPGSGQVPFGWNDELVTVAKPGGGPAGSTQQQPSADQRGLAPWIGARTQQTELTPTGDATGGDTGFTTA